MRIFVLHSASSEISPASNEIPVALSDWAQRQGMPVARVCNDSQELPANFGESMVSEVFDSRSQRFCRLVSTQVGPQCGAGDYLLCVAPRLAELDGLLRWYGGQSWEARPFLGIVLEHSIQNGLPGGLIPALSEQIHDQFFAQFRELAGSKLAYFCTSDTLADSYLTTLGSALHFLPSEQEDSFRAMLSPHPDYATLAARQGWLDAEAEPVLRVFRHLLAVRQDVHLLDGIGSGLTRHFIEHAPSVALYCVLPGSEKNLSEAQAHCAASTLNRQGLAQCDAQWPTTLAGRIEIAMATTASDSSMIRDLWGCLSETGILLLAGDLECREGGLATNGWRVDIHVAGPETRRVASLLGKSPAGFVEVRSQLLNLPHGLHWLPIPAALDPAALTLSRLERLTRIDALAAGGDIVAAAREAEAGLAADDNDSELECRLAQLLMQLGNLEGAVAHWSQLAQREPERLGIAQVLGKSLVSLGEYGIAAGLLDNHAQLSPTFSPAIAVLRKAVTRTGETSPEVVDAKPSRLGFLQVHTFYPAYLEQFYAKNPALMSQDFAAMIRSIEADAFSANHMLTPYLGALGYDCQLIVANDLRSQGRWAAQHGLPDGTGMMDVVRRQIETYRPEILYLSEPVSFDSRFLQTLSYKPKLVLGWRGAMVPPETRWTGFDVMLSGLSGIRELALKLGAAHAAHFFPGHPNWLNPKLMGIQPETDVLFAGQWTIGQHEKRNQQLIALAAAAGTPDAPFSLALHLSGQTQGVPAELAPYLRPPVYGLEMYSTLASAKIVVDGRADHWMFDPSSGAVMDVGRGETVNMRLFEVTGSGRFLITERFDNLADYFEPGVEVETFSDREELIDKIRYYLKNPEQREAIARRGRERCRRDYAMERRAAHFDRIVRRHLALATETASKAPDKAIPASASNAGVLSLMEKAEHALSRNQAQEALNLVIEAKKTRIPTRGLDVLRGRCFAALGQPWHVAECLREELRYFPDNSEAQALLARVDDRKGGGAAAQDEFAELLQAVRPYTMLSEARLRSLYDSAKQICAADLPGNFVECGVAAGGSSALLAAVIARHSRRPRKLFAFDSFSGMPTPTEHDTHQGQHAEDTGWGSGTCAAPEDSVREACRKLGAEHVLVPVKGFFEDTLPVEKGHVGSIALLHLDGDWYSSTRAILDNLYDQVGPQGIFQVDDYGHWEGCRKAIDEFQAERGIRFPIEPIDAVGVRFRKPQALPAEAAESALSLTPVVHFSTWERGGAGMAAARIQQALVAGGTQASFAVLQKSDKNSDAILVSIQGHAPSLSAASGASPYLADSGQRWAHTLSQYPNRTPYIEVFSDAESALDLRQLPGIDQVRLAHFHWVAGMVQFPVSPAALQGKPVVWTLHDMAAFTGGCHYSDGCQRYAANPGCGACPMLGSTQESDASRRTWLIRQAAYQGLDLTIVTPSRWLADCARRSPLLAGKRIEVIANGIDLECFKPRDRAALRQQWDIAPDEAVVLFGADSVANRRKGFDLLLAAVDELAKQAPGKPITLAAFGTLAADFTPPGNFRFLRIGEIGDESRLPDIYGLADVLVLPSREDNLPNTAVEALACGIPVVGFRTGGLPDIVEDGKTGWLAAPGDIGELASLILRVLTHPDRPQLASQCRAKAEADFDAVKQADKYRKLYGELLAAEESRRPFSAPEEQLNWRAENQLALGHYDAALATLEEALNLAPKHPHTLANLAMLYHSCGHSQEALDWAVQAYEADRQDPSIVLNLLHVLVSLGQRDAAQEVLQVYGNDRTPDGDFLARLPQALRAPAMPADFHPRITAIVSTYKSADFIAECLDDILAQTVADQIEIVVVDANSPENEGEIVRRYQARHPNIRYIRTPERIGVYPAWNLAIRESRGEFLISCSTNDRLRANACEILMRELDANPDVMVAYGDTLLTANPHENFDNATIGGSQFWPPYSFDRLLQECMVGCHPLWRRKAHDEVGYFDESYKAIGDQDMWLRIGERFPLKHVPVLTSLFWVTPESLSGNRSISGHEVDFVHRKFQLRADYRRWADRKSIQEIDAQLFAERMFGRWKSRPGQLIITMAGADEQAALARTLDSLQNQLYPDWKFIVLSDIPAPNPIFEQTEILGWLQLDTLDDPGVITQAINQVIDTLASDWVTLIPVGSSFEPHWTIAVADYADLHPDWRAIYTDHDHIDHAGLRSNPWFKPDFNLDYLRSMNYVGSAVWLRRDALAEVGGFQAFPGAWQYDALWRIHDRWGTQAIGHLPEPLLHLPEKLQPHPLASAATQAAVEDHLTRQQIAAQVTPGLLEGTLRITYAHGTSPRISIVIPNRDSVWYLQPCIDGILAKSSYGNYEIIVVDNQTDEPDTLDYYRHLEKEHGDRVRIVPYDKPFNFSAQCNLGVASATGDYVLLLNNDTEVVQADWLEEMLNHGQRPEVGAVGARLVYPEKGTIQHAGVVLGLDRLASHAFTDQPMNDPGYMNRLQVDQDYSAVTAACMLVRKSVYESVGGMNETDTPVLFNDVDFCLRLREAGHLIVWTPRATLVHHENKSIALESANIQKHAAATLRDEKTADFMHQRWGRWLADDPTYNRHLSLAKGTSFDPEPILVADWDRNFHDRPRVLSHPPAGGVGEYRFIAPLMALGKSGRLQSTIVQTKRYHELRYPTLTELNRLDPDVLMMQVDFSPVAQEWFAFYRKHRPDMLSVLMMDDLITKIPEDNPNYKHIPRDGRQRLRKLFRHTDRVIVSTEPLLDFARELTDDVRLVPNTIRDDLWLHLRSQRRAGRKPRVGWAGAQQHKGDLAIITEAVKQTAGEVEWIFFGMCPDEIRPYIAEFHEFEVGVEAYPAKLASLNLDLAVAPLEQHPFNEAKSNLRILEYGILGLPVICSDILPYRTDNAPVVCLPNDTTAWVEAIRERIHDLDATAREGDRLQEWVRKNYLLSNRLDDWFHALMDHRS